MDFAAFNSLPLNSLCEFLYGGYRPAHTAGTPLPGLDARFIDFVTNLQTDYAVLTDSDLAIQWWEAVRCLRGRNLLEDHRQERERFNAREDLMHLVLPLETIGEIFEHVVGHVDIRGGIFGIQDGVTCQQTRAPLVLAQISRRWRASALSNPRLWGHVIIREYTSNHVSTMLDLIARSKAGPLHVMLEFPTSPIPPTVMEFVTDNLHRIHTLHLDVSVDNLQRFSCTLPVASSFIVRTRNYSSHPHPVLGIQITPTRLLAHRLDPTGLDFSLLSSVDLEDVDLPVLYSLLKTAHRLRICKVDISALSPQVCEPLTHEYVEELSFRSFNDPTALDYLDFPNIKYVVANLASDGTLSLLGMLMRCNCKPLGFGFGEDDKQILVPLDHMPSITHVDISATYASYAHRCLAELMGLPLELGSVFYRLRSLTVFVDHEFVSDGDDEACLLQALVIFLEGCVPNPITLRIVTPQQLQWPLVQCKQGALEIRRVLDLGHVVIVNDRPLDTLVDFDAPFITHEIMRRSDDQYASDSWGFVAPTWGW